MSGPQPLLLAGVRAHPESDGSKRLFWRAQVSLPIVRQFVASVERDALGVKVLRGVRPDQQLVKVVNDQLIQLMGGQQEDLVDPKDGPQVGVAFVFIGSRRTGPRWVWRSLI